VTEAFVRTEMTPPKAPPVTERGVLKWLGENLFSGPFNTILTLASLYAIYLLASAVVPWLLNGVWTANSLQECRDIVTAAAGEGATGACWAMIRERWHQFIFGLYPAEAYWRPTLAFGLLLAAIAPVLFAGQRRSLLAILGAVAGFLALCLPLASAPVGAMIAAGLILAALSLAALTRPARMLWFTALFPGVVFFLLWGGSVWAPVVVVLGFGLVVVAFSLLAARGSLLLAAALAAVLVVVLLADPLAALLDLAGGIAGGFAPDPVTLAPGWRGIFPLLPQVSGWLDGQLPWGIPAIDSSEFGGFLLAIVIGVTAIAFSLPLGILLALGRQSDLPVVKMICVGFIEFIRGVPLITLLFTASLLLGYFLPPGTTFDTILRVMILVTFFAAAYLAEVVRGGLAALPRGQYEAADSLGLDYWRAQQLIILPQALKISIPAIVSTFIGLFKDTTLVSFVALMDPLRGVTNAVRADIDWKGIYWEPYIFVGVIFFVICFGMSRYSMYLEQKLKTDQR